MMDLRSALMSKERILSMIRLRGPSLPVQVARDLGVSTIFASAFLSELKAEGKIAISNMKVGSSPLYYIPGQEQQLENFVQHLNQREKEAFELIKKEKILEDAKQEPVMRVALRAIKDFAIEENVNFDGEQKIFWRYFAMPREEFIESLRKRFSTTEKTEESKEIQRVEDKEITAEKEDKKIKVGVSKLDKQAVLISHSVKKKSAKKGNIEGVFFKKLKDFLVVKDIELKEILVEKKKELEGIVRINSQFGKQEFYLIAKDKKAIGDEDLAVALQKAYNRKMPALFMSPGELNKKGKEYIKEWENLIKFENFKF